MSKQHALDERYDWAMVSHHDLYRAVHQRNDPGEVGKISAEWAVLSGELAEAARLIREAVAAAEPGWEGQVADVARHAMRELSDWTTELADTAAVVARQVDEQGRIMAEARAAMPEPVGFSYEEMTKPFVSGSIPELTESVVDIRAVRDRSLSCHEQAVAVMREMEEKSRALDRVQPEFRLPRNPLTGQEQEPVAPPAVQARPPSGPSGPDTAPLPVLGAETPQEPQHPRPAQPPAVPAGGKAFAPMSGDLGLSSTSTTADHLISTAVAESPQAQRTSSAPAHSTAPSPTAGTGMPMSPGMGASRQPDEERQVRYVLAEDFFASPGDELPPSVIGAEEEL